MVVSGGRALRQAVTFHARTYEQAVARGLATKYRRLAGMLPVQQHCLLGTPPFLLRPHLAYLLLVSAYALFRPTNRPFVTRLVVSFLSQYLRCSFLRRPGIHMSKVLLHLRVLS
jgi:hypothetical protein